MSHIENRPVDQKVFPPPGRRKTLFLAKQGTVAVMVALYAPLLAMTVGLGIEATGWTDMQQGMLQRTADRAGAIYNSTYEIPACERSSVEPIR
jgi:Flp pilus assembly protein TadG